MKQHGLVKDLDGIRFGKLIASNKIIRKTSFSGKREYLYRECICDCNKTCWVVTERLISGHTKSCGCFKYELMPDDAPMYNEIFGSYIRIAQKRGHTFSLTKDEVRKLIKSNCFYCGVEPSNIIKRKRMAKEFRYSGIDRIDNLNGYSPDNCVPCCIRCNQGKSNQTKKDFLIWIANVYNRCIVGKPEL